MYDPRSEDQHLPVRILEDERDSRYSPIGVVSTIRIPPTLITAMNCSAL
jgi:hypothetical protein